MVVTGSKIFKLDQIWIIWGYSITLERSIFVGCFSILGVFRFDSRIVGDVLAVSGRVAQKFGWDDGKRWRSSFMQQVGRIG